MRGIAERRGAGVRCVAPEVPATTDPHSSELPNAGDRPVYDNESFWWSTPIREDYLGLERGPNPGSVPAVRADTVG